MSEYFEVSVDAYARAPAAEIARRAGVSSELGTLGAGVMSSVAAISASFFESVAQCRQDLESLALKHDGPVVDSTGIPHLGRHVVESRSRLEALARPSVGLLAAAVHTHDPALLSSLDQHVSRLMTADGSAPTEIEALAQQAAELTRRADMVIERSLVQLRGAETATLAAAVRGTLHEMGYRVEPPRRLRSAGSTLMRGASDAGTSIFVEIDTGSGRLAADLSGFTGTSCLQERDRFLAGLRKRGIRVREGRRSLHGQPAGGLLVQAAEPLFRSETGVSPTGSQGVARQGVSQRSRIR